MPSLLGSDFGLRADLHDVRFGVSVGLAQPVVARRGAATPPSVQFATGARIDFFAAAPVLSWVTLRSGVAFTRFRGDERAYDGITRDLTCDDLSIESDFIFPFAASGVRERMYGIFGGTVDFLHYSYGAQNVFVRDVRATDNGINIGFGYAKHIGDTRLTLEFVFHKIMVHDRSEQIPFPRMNDVQVRYGVSF